MERWCACACVCGGREGGGSTGAIGPGRIRRPEAPLLADNLWPPRTPGQPSAAAAIAWVWGRVYIREAVHAARTPRAPVSRRPLYLYLFANLPSCKAPLLCLYLPV